MESPAINLIYSSSFTGDISTAHDSSTAIKSEEISFAAWKSAIILTGTTLLILFMHTSLSPAIPVIAEDMDVDQALASWVMSIYMITGAVMTILIGRFSDIFGAKKMLVLMMVIYTAATAVAGFSQDISTLLTIRAIQGIAIANTPIRSENNKGSVSQREVFNWTEYCNFCILRRNGNRCCIRTNNSCFYWLAINILHVCTHCGHSTLFVLASIASG